MKLNHLIYIIGFIIIMMSPVGLSAREEKDLPDKLVIGTLDLPPFSIKTAGDRWDGLGFDLWRAVSNDLGVDFEVREFMTISAIVDAIDKGAVDIIPVAVVAPEHEISLDFTNHYYRSGLSIAVRAESAGMSWWQLVKGIFSWKFIMVIGSLILLWALAGTLVWFLESSRNREMFGYGPVRGIGHGIWWAAVTMTTVGYGDKAPETFGGRIVAIIWMFASIILISSFTAAITTSLTVNKLSGAVRGFHDLPTVRVGSMDRSRGYNYLAMSGITVFPLRNDRDGLQALVDNKIDAFVHDEAILKYLAKTQFPAQINVLPGTFDHHYISMAIPPDSRLREALNRSILKFISTDEWGRLVRKYFGADSS